MKIFARAVIWSVAALILDAKPTTAETHTGVGDRSNRILGKTFGGTLYIYDGNRWSAAAMRHMPSPNGSTSVSPWPRCAREDGRQPCRPHMLAMNASQTHAIISFVASGHVLIMDAPTRTPIACIRTSGGAGGARQVHLAIPSPDETYIAVANQNGKLFERIDTDYSTNTFVLNTSATMISPRAPPRMASPARTRYSTRNAPICPIISSRVATCS